MIDIKEAFAVYVEARNKALEEAAQAVEMVFGGSSHKVSENSDVYRIQDHVVERCAAAVRSLKRSTGDEER